MEDRIIIHLRHRVFAPGNFDGCILKIIFNDNCHDHSAAGVGPGFHCHNRAGHRSMDRDTQSLTVTDLLTAQHIVAYLHQRGTGGTDMLLHRDYHLLRGNGLEEGDAGGHFFIIFGVNATKKQVFHSFTSCS